MEQYNHREVEQKWRRKWEEQKLYETKDKSDGENFYSLIEFPYSSGNLHVGHWYAFSVPDIFVRAKRMQGKNVLFPIGFDSFGLPAENAAIEKKINPHEWTEGNIEYMRRQLRTMGASLDWSREVVTSSPEYYKWTQWLFLQLFKNDLAYQAETTVNWCPSCKTVLANEQVVGGECERCGTEVVQRKLKQWMLKITNYAERLLEDLEELDWPEPIKISQRNWIGKSEGAEIDFEIKDSGLKVKVFTTRPDTLFGATYVVLAPEHGLISELRDQISNTDEVEKYIKEAGKKTELERIAESKGKTGVVLEGVRAINPVNDKEVPVFIADYVLSHYGTGAIMAVPAHDERDFEFAKKFKLPIVEVISGGNIGEKAFIGDGPLMNSGKFDGMDSKEAVGEITKFVRGKLKTVYKMRDWIVSRQRYWGCPIPVIHCSKCGVVPVPEDELPVKLPDIDDFMPRGDGKSPLSKAESWANVKCPKCSLEARRETDTLDTFVDSSWYFLRYTDPKNDKEFASKSKMNAWMPVDMYSGGAEHTTMHLLYSRFFVKALYDLGLVKDKEPYVVRRNRAIILGPDGAKMSKSRGNVVDPDEYVEKLGADTVRMYLAFIGPYNEVGSYPWDPKGIQGIRRFIDRIWNTQDQLSGSKNEKLESLLHKTIKKVGEDIEQLKFNTAVSKLMVLLNEAGEQRLAREQFETFLKLLAPFAPHLAEEIWEQLGHTPSIHKEAWPKYDESVFKDADMTIVVQVNGKTRGMISVPQEFEENQIKKEALSAPDIDKWVSGKEIKKVVYVKGRLINLVV